MNKGHIRACPKIPLIRIYFRDLFSIWREPIICPIGDTKFPKDDIIPVWNNEELILRENGTI